MSEGIQLAEGETRKLLLAKMEERESKETFPFTYRIGGPRQGQCSIQVKGMVPQFFAIALISYFG